MKVSKLRFSMVVLFLCLSFAAHSGIMYLKKFTFDEDKSLNKWRKMILNGEVSYRLMKYGEDGYVRALSDKTCSALYYRIGFKLENYPLLKWKWRVLQFPDISKAMNEEDRDDYAARVYIIFPFLSFSSSEFLEYVWSENMPVDTIINSPFGDNVKIIVVRSGRATEGEWMNESRDAYEDYVKAFGKEPRKKARAIAIMCDADGTKTTAEALFDDITIEHREGL